MSSGFNSEESKKLSENIAKRLAERRKSSEGQSTPQTSKGSFTEQQSCDKSGFSRVSYSPGIHQAHQIKLHKNKQ